MYRKNNALHQNKMGIMPIRKLLLTMAFPLMLSLLVQSLYNIIDSIFVARLSEQALAATSLAYPVQILMVALSVGTGVGINALISRLLGAKQKEEAGKAAVTGLALSLLSASLFMLLGLLFAKRIAVALTDNQEIALLCGQYLQICMVFCYGIFVETAGQRFLQASGRTKLSMYSLVAGALTNIILDPIMIFGYLGCPALGIRGAAIATVIGQWVGAAVALLLNHYCNPDVILDLKGYQIEKKMIAAIYKVGFPTIIMQAMGSVMNFGINSMLVDAAAIAFFGVYYKLQNFLFLPMNGLGQACLPVIGFNYGAKDGKRILETVRIGLQGGILIGIIGTLLFLLVPGPLLKLFNASEEMAEIGIPAMRIICLTLPLCAVTTILGMCTSGLGNGVINMFGTGLRQVIILLPCFALLLKFAGFPWIWFSTWIAELTAILYVLFATKKELQKKVVTLTG